MPTLNVVGETLANWEAESHRAAARDLTIAVAETAPRGCSAKYLCASDAEPVEIDHPKIEVQTVPVKRGMLPTVWRTNTAARPLDGEFVHALTPLAPIRTRQEYDGSQATVSIPHTLAWEAPELFPKNLARTFRAFTRRALKHADLVVTPTHSVAERVREMYGSGVNVQVLPLAAPAEYLAADDAPERRTSLELPDSYLLTTAYLGDAGRLEWLLRTYETHPDLSPLVVLNLSGLFDPAAWSVLEGRVHSVTPRELADVGAVIGGAEMLVLPQAYGDTGYEVYAALAQGIPVVHGGAGIIAEIALDAGVQVDDEQALGNMLSTIMSSKEELERLSVFATDRSRTFSWRATAWQLWEMHANI